MNDRISDAGYWHGDEMYIGSRPESDPDRIADERRQEAFDAERWQLSYDARMVNNFWREVCLMRDLCRSEREVDRERLEEFVTGITVDYFDTILCMKSCFEASLRKFDLTGSELDPADVLRTYEGR